MYIIHDNIDNYNDKFYDNYDKLTIYDKNKMSKLLKTESQKRFILSRYLLYNSLNKLYSIDYNNIDIYYNQYGKPFINECYFNISHSFNYCVVAISNKKIGVDIEKIRKISLNSINLFCTDNEKEYILMSKDKYKSFFQIFCLKEAYFKMLGTDLKNMKNIEFNINDENIFCSSYEKLNIILNYNIDGYIIAIIEKED